MLDYLPGFFIFLVNWLMYPIRRIVYVRGFYLNILARREKGEKEAGEIYFSKIFFRNSSIYFSVGSNQGSNRQKECGEPSNVCTSL